MKVLVAVIAYNEEKNIRIALQDLIDNNDGTYDIVVVDNGSSDDTAEVARSMGVRVVSHCVNSGGAAGTVMTYFRYADRHQYDILCQFDGDGQHLAAELKKAIAECQNGQGDYIIGSRFITGEGFQSYFARRIGINIFAALDSIVLGQKVTDVTSGCRVYSRKIIEFFSRHYRYEIVDTNQLLLLSHFAGGKIKEIPVVMRAREHGVSEFNLMRSILYPLRGFVSILGCLLQKNEIKRLAKWV